jgi:hypothetical protein
MNWDLLIGFLLGCSAGSWVILWGVRRHIRNKLALRQLINEMYHKDLLPEICRAEGLVDLATREHHHEYAKLALKVIEAIKKHEPHQ